MINRWIRNNKGFLLFLLGLGVFRTAVADWNPIPSGSMRPTLLEGDVVFVNRLAYNIKVPLTDIVVAPLGRSSARRHRHVLVAARRHPADQAHRRGARRPHRDARRRAHRQW